jgi:lysophospholipase L1-like esterase/fibronectin type 3 domain-containing protein
MPLGDSLTHGATTGAYRTQLEDLLLGDRFDFNFVGSLASGPADLEASRHEGHTGYRIDQIAASVDGWLTTHQPEFVLLLTGTNDVLQDYQLATAPDRLGALIDQIAARRPSAEILVGSIPPLTDPALDAKAREYNAAIPGIVSAKASAGTQVRFVDIYPSITTADLPDGVHPNAAGYAKIAQVWYSALAPLLPPRQPPVPRECPCTLWSDTVVPAVQQADWDTNPNELGVKFRSDVDGYITGIRFYKGPNNTGTHVGHLWTRTGTKLAEAQFTSETVSGWQQVTLLSPVPITADTTYVASYFAPVGRYSLSTGYFKDNEVVSYPLRGLAAGMSGVNGVYRFGSSGFPANSFDSSNYWVDVVFMPAPPTPPPPPPAPQGLTATAAGPSRIDLAWSDVTGEDGYRVERSPDGTTGWTAVGTTAQDVTAYSDTGLSERTTYHYRVVATSAAGPSSSPSATASATTTVTPSPPAAPQGLTATAAGPSRIDLAWNDVTGEDGYRVERSPDGTTGWTAVGTTSQDVTAYSDTGLSEGTTYHYRVIATSAAGPSSPSASASATTPLSDQVPPTAPTKLKATAAKAKTNLSWTGSSDTGGSGLAGYEVWRATASNGPFVRIAIVPPSSTSYSDGAVVSGGSYWHYVVAFDGAGNRSPSSNVVQSRPK